ncbi:polymeric immunoglobulin receptor-like [Heterodontus francisci]|uniref:polymeric immunoglobulin receptor-like n=1 Tax=Heterodontus francisci TaxID=7792 RepID=UPI00355B1304
MGFILLLSIAFLSVTHAAISGPKVKSATEGKSVDITCKFDTYYKSYQKYWCRGYYRRSCTVLVQTQGAERKSHDDRIKIKADNVKGILTVHMERLTTNDKGWYWCGIEIPHLLDELSPTELKVTKDQNLFPKDKERLRLFLTLGLIFGVLTVMLLGLVILVIKKIRKHKGNAPGEDLNGCGVEFKGMQSIKGMSQHNYKEKESTIENSIPKSNSVLSRELEEGVTYATVTIQPSDHAQEDSATSDNVKPSNSQEKIKPSVTTPPASEPTEYSTVVFKKHSVCNIGWIVLNMKNIEFTIMLIAVSLSGSHGIVGPRIVNGNLGESITVNCQYSTPSNRNSEKYWCKGGQRYSCTVMVRTQRLQQERFNRLFIVDNQTSGIFSVTMKHLSREDAGWYWCGITMLGRDEMAPVQLNVLEDRLTGSRQVNGTLGEAVTLRCHYPVSYYKDYEKYLCKGSERKLCSVIARTQKLDVNRGRRIIATDNQTSGVFAITLTELSMEDAGSYWCGITVIGYDMVPLQLNVLEPVTATTTLLTPILSNEVQKKISGKNKSTTNLSTMLVVSVLGILIVLFLTATIFVIRHRKKTAAGKKGSKHTKEESNPVFNDLSFGDDGQDITYDMATIKSSIQTEEDFPTYIYDDHHREQKTPV